MKMMRTVMAITFVAALAACGQNAAKTDAPADAAATSDGAAPATDANGKPAEPAQAPEGAAPNKPS
jgi:hypothetical protein